MNLLVPICDIVEHQKRKLAELESAYSLATRSGNYPLTQDLAKRINRVRTALVLHGALVSVHTADAEARAEEDRDKPWSVWQGGQP